MADKNETSRVVVDEDTPEISYAGNKPSDITVKVDVDISEALTGLKALQREAKKAAKELRELESSSQALRELEEAPQFNLANIIANSLPISTEDAEKVVEAIMQGRHKNGHVFPADAQVFAIGEKETLARMEGMQVFPLIHGSATIYVVKNGGDNVE